MEKVPPFSSNHVKKSLHSTASDFFFVDKLRVEIERINEHRTEDGSWTFEGR
jgi:hypothetical protein